MVAITGVSIGVQAPSLAAAQGVVFIHDDTTPTSSSLYGDDREALAYVTAPWINGGLLIIASLRLSLPVVAVDRSPEEQEQEQEPPSPACACVCVWQRCQCQEEGVVAGIAVRADAIES